MKFFLKQKKANNFKSNLDYKYVINTIIPLLTFIAIINGGIITYIYLFCIDRIELFIELIKVDLFIGIFSISILCSVIVLFYSLAITFFIRNSDLEEKDKLSDSYLKSIGFGSLFFIVILIIHITVPELFKYSVIIYYILIKLIKIKIEDDYNECLLLCIIPLLLFSFPNGSSNILLISFIYMINLRFVKNSFSKRNTINGFTYLLVLLSSLMTILVPFITSVILTNDSNDNSFDLIIITIIIGVIGVVINALWLSNKKIKDKLFITLLFSVISTVLFNKIVFELLGIKDRNNQPYIIKDIMNYDININVMYGNIICGKQLVSKNKIRVFLPFYEKNTKNSFKIPEDNIALYQGKNYKVICSYLESQKIPDQLIKRINNEKIKSYIFANW